MGKMRSEKSILKSLIDRPATMFCTFEDDKSVVRIIFESQEGAWQFLNALAEARKILDYEKKL